MTDKISVLLADDHAVVREGTREILEHQPDIKVVGEAGSGEEAVRLAKQLRPQVILMDISMPGMSGIEATRQVKESLPSTAVLVLSAYDDDAYVFAILEAGAAGYLLKNAHGSELVDAVRAVQAGESVLTPAIATKVLQRFSRQRGAAPNQPAVEQLSDRELEVLKLASAGLTNREIAHKLVLSPRTVQAHLSNIFSKLQVGSRTEAVIAAMRLGWLTLEEGEA